MDKPHKDSNEVWTYYRHGKDVWGRTVYAAYFMGRFAGYRYRLTRKEIEKRRQGVKQLGVPRWVDCPEWCVIPCGPLREAAHNHNKEEAT